jgi:predicted phosphodiesterase
LPTRPLDPNKREEILSLKRRGWSHEAIARELLCGVGTVSNVVAEERSSDAAALALNERAAKQRFQELREKFLSRIGWDGKPPKTPPKSKARQKKILVLSDPHVPYHDKEALQAALAVPADTVILSGDGPDNYSFSRYEKTRQLFSPLEELREFQAFLTTLSERYPEVIVMQGNHDARFVKYLVRRGITPDVLEYFNAVAPGFTTPVERMTIGLENVKVVPPIKLDYADFAHIYQHGDIVFSHAEKFSVLANKAAADVAKWVKSFAVPAGIVKEPVRVIAHAHTHMAGKTWSDFGIVAYELGTLSAIPDYAADPKLRGATRLPVLGYTEFYQTDGVTDINKSNFVELKWNRR